MLHVLHENYPHYNNGVLCIGKIGETMVSCTINMRLKEDHIHYCSHHDAHNMQDNLLKVLKIIADDMHLSIAIHKTIFFAKVM